MLICDAYFTWLKQFKPWMVPAVVDSIVVLGTMTCCALFHSAWDLKATQMNMQRSLIREFVLYEFEQRYNVAETTKNISCVKGKRAVDHNIVTGRFKKFRLGCKNLDHQVRLSRPYSVDFEAVLQAIEANPTTSMRWLSGEFSLVLHVYDLGKILWRCRSIPHLIKMSQNFWFIQAVYFLSQRKKD